MKIWQKFFFKLNYKVFVVCKYISLNLKKYCEKIICLNFGEELKINNFIEKIKNKENLEILIGSGFSEHLAFQPLSINKFDRGNTVKKHKLIKSEKFFRELRKHNINIPEWSLTKPRSKNVWLKTSNLLAGIWFTIIFRKKFKKFRILPRRNSWRAHISPIFLR